MVINVHGDDGHAQEHDKDLLVKNRADDYLESRKRLVEFGRGAEGVESQQKIDWDLAGDVRAAKAEG